MLQRRKQRPKNPSSNSSDDESSGRSNRPVDTTDDRPHEEDPLLALIDELERDLDLMPRPGRRPALSVKGGMLTARIDYTDPMRVAKGREGSWLNEQLGRLLRTNTTLGTQFVTKYGTDDNGPTPWLMRAVNIYWSNLYGLLKAGVSLESVVPLLLKQSLRPTRTPVDALNQGFEHEVVRVGGWFKKTLINRLQAPTNPRTLQWLHTTYHPGRTETGESTIGPLDRNTLKNLLSTELRNVVASELSLWRTDSGGETERRPFNHLMQTADFIQSWIRNRLNIYPLAEPQSPYYTGFVYSSQLISTLTKETSLRQQLGWLRNRGDLVGWSKDWGAPYVKGNYDPGREADRLFREEIFAELLKDDKLTAALNDVIRLTASHSLTTGTIAIVPFFPNPSMRSKTDHLWREAHTLIHEFLHRLTHENFHQAAKSIGYRQILDEGMTDLLAATYFQVLVNDVRTDPVVRKAILGDAPFTEPEEHLLVPGYGNAGILAGKIKEVLGLPNICAAYFLGATELIGLK